MAFQINFKGPYCQWRVERGLRGGRGEAGGVTPPLFFEICQYFDKMCR